jgi:hypothetical protein
MHSTARWKNSLKPAISTQLSKVRILYASLYENQLILFKLVLKKMKKIKIFSDFFLNIEKNYQASKRVGFLAIFHPYPQMFPILCFEKELKAIPLEA